VRGHDLSFFSFASLSICEDLFYLLFLPRRSEVLIYLPRKLLCLSNYDRGIDLSFSFSLSRGRGKYNLGKEVIEKEIPAIKRVMESKRYLYKKRLKRFFVSRTYSIPADEFIFI